MNILERIMARKRLEVEAAMKQTPIRGLERKVDNHLAPRGFRRAIEDSTDAVAIIAELKCASPSAGVIREDYDPPAIARSYARGGASALSVLTDGEDFRGSLAHLEAVRDAVYLPLLRKDFLLDPYQVLEARAAGADAVLLIVAVLEDRQLRRLADEASGFGMDALVEVHDRVELERALDSGADLIGINHRNLKTFEVDLRVSAALMEAMPTDVTVVGESGIQTAGDLIFLESVGVRAALVGEHFMRAEDPGAALRELRGGE